MQSIKRGAGFAGVVRYVFSNPHARLLSMSDVMTGDNPSSIVSMFAVSKAARPDIKKLVWHQSLRLPEGEKVTDEKWREITDEYMRRMGYDRELHQWIVVQHDDAEGQHVHIVASRAGLDGSLYLGKNDNLKSSKIIAELEIEHGLRRVGPGLSPDSPAARGRRRAEAKPTHGEAERAARESVERRGTRDVPPRTQLQRLIKRAAKTGDLVAFLAALEAAGVQVHAAAHPKTGAIAGLSYTIAGEHHRGSKLGAAYSWSRLADEISYDPRQHEELLRKRIARQEPNGLAGVAAIIVGVNLVAGGASYQAVPGRSRGVEMLYIHRPLDQVALVERERRIDVRLTDAETLRAGADLAARKWRSFKLTGSDSFKQAALAECVAMRLEAKVKNPELQDDIRRLVSQRDTPSTSPSVAPVAAPQILPHATTTTWSSHERSREPHPRRPLAASWSAIPRLDDLRTLSGRRLDDGDAAGARVAPGEAGLGGVGQGGREVLLPRDARHQLVDAGAAEHGPLRRPARGVRRRGETPMTPPNAPKVKATRSDQVQAEWLQWIDARQRKVSLETLGPLGSAAPRVQGPATPMTGSQAAAAETHLQELQQRLEAIALIRRDPLSVADADRAYLTAAAAWSAGQISTGEVLDSRAWRKWDQEQGAAILLEAYQPNRQRAAAALTRLSPAAVMSAHALILRPGASPVIAEYGTTEIERVLADDRPNGPAALTEPVTRHRPR